MSSASGGSAGAEDASGSGAASQAGSATGQRIVKKLSVDLLKTYNTINQKYYARKKARQAERNKRKQRHNNGLDDENYDYIINPSERLNDRYVVQSVIGKGSFGRVVKAYDEKNSVYVAVKIVKSKRAFLRQAQIELAILKTLQEGDPDDQHHLIRMKDQFVHHNHQCIVFELLSFNLYELLRDTRFHGVSLNLIRKFAKQLLKTLSFLDKHKGGIIHCDLKPENILLKNSRHSAIKVIDFGSACFANDRMYTYIQSRFYRAPEVLLGVPYTTAIDMWSLGCILVEMHTGRPLFNGSTEHEQMQLQVQTLGLPPVSMLVQGRKTMDFFTRVEASAANADGTASSSSSSSSTTTPSSSSSSSAAAAAAAKVDADNKNNNSNNGSSKNGAKRHVFAIRPCESLAAASRNHKRDLRKIIGVDTHGPHGLRRHERTGHTLRDYVYFLDLVRRCLIYDPEKRIKPDEALKHKFFLASCNASTLTDISFPISRKLDLTSGTLGSTSTTIVDESPSASRKTPASSTAAANSSSSSVVANGKLRRPHTGNNFTSNSAPETSDAEYAYNQVSMRTTATSTTNQSNNGRNKQGNGGSSSLYVDSGTAPMQ